MHSIVVRSKIFFFLKVTFVLGFIETLITKALKHPEAPNGYIEASVTIQRPQMIYWSLKKTN